MEKQIKRFVVFYTPGAFVADTWSEDVDSLDPKRIKWPENAYCFTLHQREDIVDGKAVFKGDAKRVGPMYYHPDSKVETLEQVRQNPKATSTLISNMECNEWPQIIWNRWGHWPQPFDPKNDEVL